MQNGHVFAWGYNGEGQLGNGTTTDGATPIQIDAADLHDIKAVAAGTYNPYALAADGSVWDWGYANADLPPPNGYVCTALSSSGTAGGRHVLAILSPALPRILSLARPNNGHFILQGTGTPNVTYTVLAASDLSAGSFTPIGKATTDTSGSLRYDAGAVGIHRGGRTSHRAEPAGTPLSRPLAGRCR